MCKSTTVLEEAQLPPLLLRAKELTATEYARLVEDPCRNLLLQTPTPKFKYKAHTMWTRSVNEASEAGE